MTLSELAGDYIYQYAEVDKDHKSQCYALAQIAYIHCKIHKKAILCMCKQGQIVGAIDYLHQVKPLPPGRVQSFRYLYVHIFYVYV